MIPQTLPARRESPFVPFIAIAQPPACVEVKTGEEFARLKKIALYLLDKGERVKGRLAAFSGEKFYIDTRQATCKHGTYTLAAFHSRTIPGHLRLVIVTPSGEVWTLHDDKAIHQANKYRAKLWEMYAAPFVGTFGGKGGQA